MKKLLTINKVLELLQIKRSTFYYLRKNGAFPKPVFITGGQKSQRWIEEDVLEFIAARDKLDAIK